MKKIKTLNYCFIIFSILLWGAPIKGETKKESKDSIQIKQHQKSIAWQVVLGGNLNVNGAQLFDKSSIRDNIYETNSFSKGSFEMRNFIVSLKQDERTVNKFTSRIGQDFFQFSFEEKLGALAYLNRALYDHYNMAGLNNFQSIDQDNLFAKLVANRSREDERPELIGTCRDYVFLTAKIAEEGLGLKAAVVRGHRHVMAQVVTPDKTLVLINEGLIITDVDGQPLRTKDDVDIAIMREMKKPAIEDIIIDPIKNAVIYENRYNNFAGFWKRLQNRDNSDRTRGFLMENRQIELFTPLNEAGAIYGQIEKGNIGAQVYWIRDNNEYQRFIRGVQGLNLAASHNSINHALFMNVGLYRTVMNLRPELDLSTIDIEALSAEDLIANMSWRKKLMATADAQINIEDYLKYSINTNLSLGLISKIQYNKELFRENHHQIKDGDGYAGLSPFISWKIFQQQHQVYFCAGSEITDYLALPNLWRLNAIPWFQLGVCDGRRANLGMSLRGEFQRASQRFDWASYLKKDSRQFQLRVFYEQYNKMFKERNLFKDGAGVEVGMAQNLKKNRQILATVSGEHDNCGARNVLLNFGLKF